MNRSSLPIAFPASLVLASPAFWMVYRHTFELSDALRRWAICLALSWAAIGVVRALAFPSLGAVGRPEAAADAVAHGLVEPTVDGSTEPV